MPHLSVQHGQLNRNMSRSSTLGIQRGADMKETFHLETALRDCTVYILCINDIRVRGLKDRNAYYLARKRRIRQ